MLPGIFCGALPRTLKAVAKFSVKARVATGDFVADTHCWNGVEDTPLATLVALWTPVVRPFWMKPAIRTGLFTGRAVLPLIEIEAST